MSTIIQRARASGKCPPSLLRDDEDINFESATVKVVDVNELQISSGPTVPDDFKKLLEVR